MKEWQPYFYLNHRDFHPNNPGKAIGLIILIFSMVLLVLWFLGIHVVELYLIPLYIVFGLICLFIGRIVHYERQEDLKPPEEPHKGEIEEYDDYETLMERADKDSK